MISNLLLGLLIILIGAELFTNGIEWLGVRLGLSEGAVGSVLAAVGTALPESIIPIVAILFSKGIDSSHIGIGAILGAPFMLGTLALCIAGLSARLFLWRGTFVNQLNVDMNIVRRDLIYFIFLYSLALGASFTDIHFIRVLIVVTLVLSYGYYVLKTLVSGDEIAHNDLKPLYCCFWREQPKLSIILLQVIIALGLIILGADYFVDGINTLAGHIGMPALVLALIIAPVATELPEKFNSIIWISQRKDTLAIGNITGAMVFQSSLIPAFGIIATPWKLNTISLLSGILVLFSTTLLLFSIFRTGRLRTSALIFSGLFYLIFMNLNPLF